VLLAAVAAAAAFTVLQIVRIDPCVKIWLNLEERKPSSDEDSVRQGVKFWDPPNFAIEWVSLSIPKALDSNPRPDSHLYLSES